MVHCLLLSKVKIRWWSQFINKAIENGASAIIYNDHSFGEEKITTIKTPNTRKALSIVASNFYDNPSKKIKLVGVTGT